MFTVDYALKSGDGFVIMQDGKVTFVPESTDKKVRVIAYYTIKSGDYVGEMDSVEFTVTVPAFDSSVTAADNNGGAVAVNANNASVEYEAAKGGEYVKIVKTANGFTYTFNKGAYGKEIEVLITATVTEGTYIDYTYTKSVTLTAPAEIAPVAVNNAAQKKIEASQLQNVTVGYKVTSGGEYVTVKSDGSYTFVGTETQPQTAVITVTFTVTSGVYRGCEYVLTVNVITVSGIIAEYSWDVANQKGTVTYSLNYENAANEVVNVEYSQTGNGITVDDNGAFVKNAGIEQDTVVTVTVTYNNGATVSHSVTVEYSALTELPETDNVSGGGSGNGGDEGEQTLEVNE